MATFHDLNIEQSLASYLASKFVDEGLEVYWKNTQQTQGAGDDTVTFVRDFPEDPTYLVMPDQELRDSTVRVPAITVRCTLPPSARETDAMGIGETVMDWRAELRVEAFAATERQWYNFRYYFSRWLANEQVRIPIADYAADLEATPDADPQPLRIENPDLRPQEFNSDIEAARYYIQFAATLRFAE